MKFVSGVKLVSGTLIITNFVQENKSLYGHHSDSQLECLFVLLGTVISLSGGTFVNTTLVDNTASHCSLILLNSEWKLICVLATSLHRLKSDLRTKNLKITLLYA